MNMKDRWKELKTKKTNPQKTKLSGLFNAV